MRLERHLLSSPIPSSGPARVDPPPPPHILLHHFRLGKKRKRSWSSSTSPPPPDKSQRRSQRRRSSPSSRLTPPTATGTMGTELSSSRDTSDGRERQLQPEPVRASPLFLPRPSGAPGGNGGRAVPPARPRRAKPYGLGIGRFASGVRYRYKDKITCVFIARSCQSYCTPCTAIVEFF